MHVCLWSTGSCAGFQSTSLWPPGPELAFLIRLFGSSSHGRRAAAPAGRSIKHGRCHHCVKGLQERPLQARRPRSPQQVKCALASEQRPVQFAAQVNSRVLQVSMSSSWMFTRSPPVDVIIGLMRFGCQTTTKWPFVKSRIINRSDL